MKKKPIAQKIKFQPLNFITTLNHYKYNRLIVYNCSVYLHQLILVNQDLHTEQLLIQHEGKG